MCSNLALPERGNGLQCGYTREQEMDSNVAVPESRQWIVMWLYQRAGNRLKYDSTREQVIGCNVAVYQRAGNGL